MMSVMLVPMYDMKVVRRNGQYDNPRMVLEDALHGFAQVMFFLTYTHKGYIVEE
jgi:hypothetical protein